MAFLVLPEQRPVQALPGLPGQMAVQASPEPLVQMAGQVLPERLVQTAELASPEPLVRQALEVLPGRQVHQPKQRQVRRQPSCFPAYLASQEPPALSCLAAQVLPGLLVLSSQAARVLPELKEPLTQQGLLAVHSMQMAVPAFQPMPPLNYPPSGQQVLLVRQALPAFAVALARRELPVGRVQQVLPEPVVLRMLQVLRVLVALPLHPYRLHCSLLHQQQAGWLLC